MVAACTVVPITTAAATTAIAIATATAVIVVAAGPRRSSRGALSADACSSKTSAALVAVAAVVCLENKYGMQSRLLHGYGAILAYTTPQRGRLRIQAYADETNSGGLAAQRGAHVDMVSNIRRNKHHIR